MECKDIAAFRAFKAAAWKGIEGDEVDFSRDATQQFNQLPRVFEAVVDTAQHDVFPGHTTVLTVMLHVLMTGIKQGIQSVAGVDRHDLIAQFVVWCMQRNGEAEISHFAQSVNGGNNTGSAEGDTPF